MLRMMAYNMAGALLSVYMYQNGFSLLAIILFWAAFYAFKAIISIPAASIAAWIGPKHGILFSNLLYIPSMIAFALLPEFGNWLLIPIVFFQGLSTTLYVVSYNIDFSSVKSVAHAGKELAYMNIIEKFATGLSPLIGGLMAFFFGPETVLWAAAVLFILAALPLLLSGEPTQMHQKVRMRDFPWRSIKGAKLAQWSIGVDVFASGTVWWMFTAVAIIGIQSGNEVYAANGILMSVVMFSALFSSYVFGKLIDKDRGAELMKFSAIGNAITHFIRPFIGNPVGVAGLNIANEASTAGYSMAFHKGMFDGADTSGQRAMYMGVSELFACLGALSGALVLAGLLMMFEEIRSMQYYFLFAAAAVLFIARAKFPLYKK